MLDRSSCYNFVYGLLRCLREPGTPPIERTERLIPGEFCAAPNHNLALGSSQMIIIASLSGLAKMCFGTQRVNTAHDIEDLNCPKSPQCATQRLFRNHPNRIQPAFNQLRLCDRKTRSQQPECMPACRIQMHLNRNASVL
jgi:hypothetical protein